MEFEVGKLIESFGVSISNAQQGLENHALQRFFHYFGPVSGGNASPRKEWIPGNAEYMQKEEWETQLMEPATAKILMPCEDDLSKKTVMEIPLVTLASHMQVQLNKVTVKVNTKFITDSAGGVKMDFNTPVANGMNSSDHPENGANDSGMIEMVFQIAEMPEGESRVMQNIERVL